MYAQMFIRTGSFFDSFKINIKTIFKVFIYIFLGLYFLDVVSELNIC